MKTQNSRKQGFQSPNFQMNTNQINNKYVLSMLANPLTKRLFIFGFA